MLRSVVARPRTIRVPIGVRDEIMDVARRAQRSIAFVAQRALNAGKGAPPLPMESESVELVLATDEDDAADLARKLDAALQQNSLPEAWLASRARFLEWVAKLDAAQAAE